MRDSASVTITEPVDGRVHHRSGPRRKLVTSSYSSEVHQLVMTKAKALLRPGQRLKVVSATEVLIVNVRA